MELWCERHKTNHVISDDKVERIIYAFQFALAEQESSEPITDFDSPVRCLNEVLLWSIAQDVYAEAVTAFVERREESEIR